MLLGKRGKNAKGPWQGTWGLPGGHLEFMERADECIVREVAEELGIQVSPKDVELAAVTDGLSPERGDHYIHLTFRVDIGTQEPVCNEPDMCEGWEWFPLDELPDNIFPPHKDIIAALLTKRIYNHE